MVKKAKPKRPQAKVPKGKAPAPIKTSKAKPKAGKKY
jgi:hypothetical protein